MKSRISSFDFEETDEEDENDLPEIKPQFETKNAFVRVEATDTSIDTAVGTSQLPQVSPDHGLFPDQSHCIEVTSKNTLCYISVSPVAG